VEDTVVQNLMSDSDSEDDTDSDARSDSDSDSPPPSAPPSPPPPQATSRYQEDEDASDTSDDVPSPPPPPRSQPVAATPSIIDTGLLPDVFDSDDSAGDDDEEEEEDEEDGLVQAVVGLQTRLEIAITTDDPSDLLEQAVTLQGLNLLGMDEKTLRKTGVGAAVKEVRGEMRPQALALVRKWKAHLAAAARGEPIDTSVRRHSNPRPMSTKDKEIAVQRCVKVISQTPASSTQTVAKVLTILDGMALSDQLLSTSGVEQAVAFLGKEHHALASMLVVRWGCQRARGKYGN
jgi:hypothetical protein